MSMIEKIKAQIDATRTRIAEAVESGRKAKSIDDHIAAASVELGGKRYLERLEADLAAAGLDAELDRLREARKARIAAAAEGQAVKLRAANAVRDSLADALVEALDAAHVGIEALERLGLPVDLEMPCARGALDGFKAEILRRAAALEADARRSPEDVESDLESRSWGVVRQARTAVGSKLPPHQTRLWLNDETATGSLEIFIREGVEWRGNGGDEACERALALHLLDGWALDPADDLDEERAA
jgi:hypothetical protein